MYQLGWFSASIRTMVSIARFHSVRSFFHTIYEHVRTLYTCLYTRIGITVIFLLNKKKTTTIFVDRRRVYMFYRKCNSMLSHAYELLEETLLYFLFTMRGRIINISHNGHECTMFFPTGYFFRSKFRVCKVSSNRWLNLHGDKKRKTITIARDHSESTVVSVWHVADPNFSHLLI